MSNKPKIFGFCSAGCKWETVHKSDFEQIASHIIVPSNADGIYVLEKGKEYKIYADKNNGFFTASLTFYTMPLEGSVYPYYNSINTPVVDEYADHFTFKLLECSAEKGCIYEYCGTRYKQATTDCYSGNTPAVTLSGATKVLQYNAGAEIAVTSKLSEEQATALDNLFIVLGAPTSAATEYEAFRAAFFEEDT